VRAIKEFHNSLLKRKEIIIGKEYDANPGFSQTGKDIATHFKVSEDVVVVRRVGSNFGSNEFVIDFFIYDSVKDKENIEPKKKEKKGEKN
jgi:ribosomal protein S24E